MGRYRTYEDYTGDLSLADMSKFKVGDIVGVSETTVPATGFVLCDELHMGESVAATRRFARIGLEYLPGQRTAKIVFVNQFYLTVQYLDLTCGLDHTGSSWRESFGRDEIEKIIPLRRTA